MKTNEIIPELKNQFKQHPLPISIALGVILLLTGLLVFSGGSKQPATAYHLVQRGDFLVSIVEGGTLEAVNEIIVRNELEGSSRIIYIIPEGSFVKKGDLIVQLDSSETEDRLNQQQITYEKSIASFIAASNNLAIQKSTIESDIRAGELVVKFAGMDLQKYTEIELNQEQRDIDITIITAQESLKLAEDKLNWSEQLTSKGFETKSNLDSHRLAVTNQVLSLEQAMRKREMLLEYDQRKKLDQYRADLQEAEKALDRVKKQGASKLAQFEADLKSEENTLHLNRSKLEKMKEQMAATKLYAPSDGLVVYASAQSRYSSESIIEEGATVRNRQEIIKLPDTTKMKVKVSVHESHINQVNQGQLAYVVLDSMPDTRFKGVVSKVALLPDAQSRYGGSSLKVYATEILITDPLPDVKPGISASTEIVVTNLIDVITVPIQSVTTVQGHQVVFTPAGSKPKPKKVEIGLFNNKFIEIKSGLEAGEKILLAPPLNSDVADLGGAIINKNDDLQQPDPSLIPKETQTSAPPPSPSEGQPGGSRSFGGGPDGNSSPGGNGGGGFGGRGPGNGGPGGGGGFDREAMMKEYDKDGDGTLNDEERETMRAAMRARFGNGGGGGGRGGNREGGGQRPPRGEGGGERPSPPSQ